MAKGLVAWLNEQLDERGWSFSELARRAGLNPSTVSLVLSEQRNPGLEFCVKVAGALEEEYPFLLELAGLVPQSPPHVHEEREALAILRNLGPVQRQTALAMLRGLKNATHTTPTPNNTSHTVERADDQNLCPQAEAAIRRITKEELRRFVGQTYSTLDALDITTQEDQGETIPRLAGEWRVEERKREKGEC